VREPGVLPGSSFRGGGAARSRRREPLSAILNAQGCPLSLLNTSRSLNLALSIKIGASGVFLPDRICQDCLKRSWSCRAR